MRSRGRIVIDGKLANRLDGLEQERFRLVRRAAGYRLQAFNAVEDLLRRRQGSIWSYPVLRYAREHWALTATLLAVASSARDPSSHDLASR